MDEYNNRLNECKTEVEKLEHDEFLSLFDSVEEMKELPISIQIDYLEKYNELFKRATDICLAAKNDDEHVSLDDYDIIRATQKGITENNAKYNIIKETSELAIDELRENYTKYEIAQSKIEGLEAERKELEENIAEYEAGKAPKSLLDQITKNKRSITRYLNKINALKEKMLLSYEGRDSELKFEDIEEKICELIGKKPKKIEKDKKQDVKPELDVDKPSLVTKPDPEKKDDIKEEPEKKDDKKEDSEKHDGKDEPSKVPEKPKKITRKPGFSWKSVAAIAAGMGFGVVAFLGLRTLGGLTINAVNAVAQAKINNRINVLKNVRLGKASVASLKQPKNKTLTDAERLEKAKKEEEFLMNLSYALNAASLTSGLMSLSNPLSRASSKIPVALFGGIGLTESAVREIKNINEENELLAAEAKREADAAKKEAEEQAKKEAEKAKEEAEALARRAAEEQARRAAEGEAKTPSPLPNPEQKTVPPQPSPIVEEPKAESVLGIANFTEDDFRRFVSEPIKEGVYEFIDPETSNRIAIPADPFGRNIVDFCADNGYGVENIYVPDGHGGGMFVSDMYSYINEIDGGMTR